MILYFSGTGNSQYVAKRISKDISDDNINLLKKIQSDDYSYIKSVKPWIIVVPTYAWRIPRIVSRWLKNTNLRGNKNIYFVMTCGGNIGNPEKYLKLLCSEKKMNYCGCIGIKMPENYIALFSTPAHEDALKIIEHSEKKIDEVSLIINNGDNLPGLDINFKDKINSGIVNKAFYPIVVHSKKFKVKDNCISCGKCVRVCPLKNIQLEKGRPTWGNKCTHCMACICRCPKESIEYGNHTKGLIRYVCPKQI